MQLMWKYVQTHHIYVIPLESMRKLCENNVTNVSNVKTCAINANLRATCGKYAQIILK